ncbi:M23 family metallopeptidase [Treponema sp. OMZ 840]|uniref:peptidoglycan DD-metalloendopeptidase family protein n=1 Tax=Treponema sp. OMZ 840 TaxID=244313 RepID=UPI003D94E752
MKKHTVHKYKSVFVFAAVLLYIIPLYAFNWPQLADNIAVFFTQKHADTFNRGLIFNKPGEVKAADKGDILITLKSDIEAAGWFPSTLGNAVIISHKNHILTVYGGLEKNSADDGSGSVEAEALIGISGNSGWKQGEESLQFQVIDTKIKAAINPLILMNSAAAAKPFSIKNIRIKKKNDNPITLTNGMHINGGTYTVFTDIVPGTMPYTTGVSVNGNLIEKTDYTALKTYLGTLCIQGDKHYDLPTLYPDTKTLRLAEIVLSKGKNTIDISVKDIGMKETSFHININVF